MKYVIDSPLTGYFCEDDGTVVMSFVTLLNSDQQSNMELNAKRFAEGYGRKAGGVRLTTLLEYQRCYDLLREAASPPLSKLDYMDALRAKGAFDAELEEHIKPIELEIT